MVWDDGNMRRDPVFFGDREVELVYIAKRLRHALKLEKSLTEAGVDYAVQTETYHGGIIFRSERVGAFFYVLLDAVEAARHIIENLGLRPHQDL
jgi:prenyltransferase beta subunit